MDQTISVTNSTSGYLSLRWLLSRFFLPVIGPWLLYKIITAWIYKSKEKSKLENKVVLITGASSGLGEALAIEFYKCGSKVILASRKREELERVRDKLLNIKNLEGLPKFHPAIIQLDLEDVKSLSDKAKEIYHIHHRIDFVINNAGISYRGEAFNTSVDVDIKVMTVNYFGQIALTKAFLPYMMENNSGHIISIGSVQGKIAIPYRSAYAASKHALQAFFDSLRAELYGYNIHITVINPGYIRTNISINAVTGDGSQYGMLDKTTASGMDVTVAAKKILRATVLEQKEITMSSCVPSLAVYLRSLCPSVYFALMKSRAKKHGVNDSKKGN